MPLLAAITAQNRQLVLIFDPPGNSHHSKVVGNGDNALQHAGLVIVADGTEDAAKRLERVLWNDPATGVMRHADAGYEIALDCAKEKGLKLPAILNN